ncbi:MAG: hypothetical protein HRT75_05155 [Gilvibacter sp.]|nr:hypothetical protein [Gilvibacter sp.]
MSPSLFAQDLRKSYVQSVLEETLRKSRNPVSNATNEWRYDNTHDDYFTKDTIVLNSARTYRQSYCKTIYWSFYEANKCIINTVPECTEPPTGLIPKEEDYVSVHLIENEQGTFIHLINTKGIRARFRILALNRNEPIDNGLSQFDYDLVLLRM